MKAIFIITLLMCYGTMTSQIDSIVSTKVYDIVEVMPEFTGGNQKMYDFIHENFVYPQIISESNFIGKVYYQFVVNEDGSLSHFKLLRSSGMDQLDNEALRVLKIMPNWTPGKHKHKEVKVRFILPIQVEIER